MPSLAGYAVRAPRPDEVGRVADVFAAAADDDPCESTLDAGFFRDAWSRGGFDVATDAWVASDGAGTIVAYAHVRLEEASVVESLGVVHPGHVGRGIGSSLLDLIEQRATELVGDRIAAPRIRHAIDAHDRDAAAMLHARGLRCVRHFWHMTIDIAGPPEPVTAPTGVEIRVIAPDDDLPTVHRILSEAFAGHWGHHAEPYDRWEGQQTASPSYDPTLWLLATVDGTPSGVLTANVYGDRGWVDEIGVLAAYRGRGIGAALLRRSFSVLGRRGVRSVTLNVDSGNATGAVRLYEGVGMRVVVRWSMWEGELSRSASR